VFIVTQQRPTVEQFTSKIRNLPLQTKDWTWANCNLITVWHQGRTVNLALVQCLCHTGVKWNFWHHSMYACTE